MSQFWALGTVGIVVLVVATIGTLRSRITTKKVVGTQTKSTNDPYIIYFTGDHCSVCRTHQEPALAKLPTNVRIDKVDAIADRAQADRFHVYTLPTTVVVSSEGKVLHVNYGYATTSKLKNQIEHATHKTDMSEKR